MEETGREGGSGIRKGDSGRQRRRKRKEEEMKREGGRREEGEG